MPFNTLSCLGFLHHEILQTNTGPDFNTNALWQLGFNDQNQWSGWGLGASRNSVYRPTKREAWLLQYSIKMKISQAALRREFSNTITRDKP